MILRKLNKYSAAAILLLVAATIFVVIAVQTNLSELVTATFVLSSMICAVTGIFTLMFSGGEPVDPEHLGILSAQGCITFCRLAHHLGYRGNAYFLPPRVTGESRVMQFNPISTYKEIEGCPTGSFRNTGPPGLVTTPFCDPLIQDLKKRHEMVIPYDKEDITLLLRETIEDILKFAPRVSATWNSSTITITFHKYLAINGCSVIAKESPQCCSMSPCAVCSLCGALIAEGLERVVVLEKCSISPFSRDVVAVFSVLV